MSCGNSLPSIVIENKMMPQKSPKTSSYTILLLETILANNLSSYFSTYVDTYAIILYRQQLCCMSWIALLQRQMLVIQYLWVKDVVVVFRDLRA